MFVHTFLLRAAGIAAVVFLVSGGSPTAAQVRGTGEGSFPREPKSVTESQSRSLGGMSAPQPKYLNLSRNMNASASQAVKYGDMARQANPPNYEVALVWYQRALTKDPTEVRAHVGLGKVYDVQLRYDESLEAYQRAIAAKPKFVGAHVALGYSLTNQALYDKAMESFTTAITIDPKSVDARLGVADLLFAQRRFAEAVDAYRRTLELKPKSLEANYSLGVTYLLLKNRDAAIAQARRLNSLDKAVAAKLEELIFQTSGSKK